MNLLDKVASLCEGDVVDVTYRVTVGKDGYLMHGGRVIADTAFHYIDPSIVRLETASSTEDIEN